MLAAFAANCAVFDIGILPVSVYWQFVNEGINKMNGFQGGLKLKSQQTSEKETLQRAQKRIAELRAQGKWPTR